MLHQKESIAVSKRFIGEQPRLLRKRAASTHRLRELGNPDERYTGLQYNSHEIAVPPSPLDEKPDSMKKKREDSPGRRELPDQIEAALDEADTKQGNEDLSLDQPQRKEQVAFGQPGHVRELSNAAEIAYYLDPNKERPHSVVSDRDDVTGKPIFKIGYDYKMGHGETAPIWDAKLNTWFNTNGEDYCKGVLSKPVSQNPPQDEVGRCRHLVPKITHLLTVGSGQPELVLRDFDRSWQPVYRRGEDLVTGHLGDRPTFNPRDGRWDKNGKDYFAPPARVSKPSQMRLFQRR